MRSSKSSLFLMEILICILFFSIASAICVQLFAKAHLLDQKTGQQNLTIMWTQNLAELWKHHDADLRMIHKQLSEDYPSQADAFLLSESENLLTLYFNDHYQLDANNVSYTIIIKNNPYDDELRLYSATISILHGQDSLCELPLSYHPATERGTVYE